MVTLENNTEGVGGGVLNKLNETQQNESNITKVKDATTLDTTNTATAVTAATEDEDLVKTELRKVNNHRHSNESGT